MINKISSENLDRCLKYTYIDKIATLEYASFLRFLVMTTKKELPIEISNNDDNTVIKGKVVNFSIDYEVDREGENDNLTLKLVTMDDKKQQILKFLNLGKKRVGKDNKSGPRTFYRFYLYPENNEEGYRCTFNRRVTKK